MDHKWMHLEVFALPGIFLLLLYRQTGLEPSCGLKTKLASKKIVEMGKEQ